jgi:hypothetical protein
VENDDILSGSRALAYGVHTADVCAPRDVPIVGYGGALPRLGTNGLAVAPTTKKSKPYRVTFCLNLYNRESDRPIAHRAVTHMLRALTLIGVDYLRHHPETPNLYSSGVRYEEEPPGQEDWQDIPTTLELGYGDCEDLACWRAAEYQVRFQVDAWPSFVWRRRPRGGLLYHIQVRLPDGRVEDPSRRLGMR